MVLCFDMFLKYLIPFRHGIIVNSERRKILGNGSLYLEAVIGTDAANYSCKAENDYGSDVITYSLSVQGICSYIFYMYV